jgi:hypothetical protein
LTSSPTALIVVLGRKVGGTVHDTQTTAWHELIRGGFAVRLWVRDALRLQFGDYHWEKRRRRLHDRDKRTGYVKR